MNKIPLLFSFICFVIYRMLFYFTENSWLSLSIFLVPLGLLIFSFSVRKHLSFSAWFLSPANIFIERRSHSSESDLDGDLLYHKLLEVVDNSDFRLLDTNTDKLQFLLGTSANFWTWGENIYVQVVPSPDGSVIQLNSVTLFGNASWNRNDQHFHSFIESFESSLII